MPRWFRGLAVASFAVLTLAACGESNPPAAQPDATGEPAAPATTAPTATAGENEATEGGEAEPGAEDAVSEIAVGLSVPNYGPYAPVFAAEELGFYEDNGLSVEITAYRSGSAAQQALAGGSADIIHYFPAGVATAIEQGVEQQIVAADQAQGDGWHVLVREDSEAQSIEDLAGGTIGITGSGSTTDFYAAYVAEQIGGDLQRIPLGGAGLVGGLQAGQVDAIVSYPPLGYTAEANGLRILYDFGTEMPPNLPDVITATSDIIENNPQAVQGYLQAVHDAIVHMQENEEYSVDFLVEHTGNDAAIEQQEYESAIMKLNAPLTIEQEWLENARQLAEIGGVTSWPDDIYNDSFVTAVE